MQNVSEFFQSFKSKNVLCSQNEMLVHLTEAAEELQVDLEYLLEALLYEVRTKILDEKLRRLIRSRRVRRKMLEKCGEKAFLKPDDVYPKFPVMTPKCKYHCGLILAAYLRARSWHYEDIAQKAIKLYYKLGCNNKLKIEIRQRERKTWAPRIPKKMKHRVVKKRPRIHKKLPEF